MKFLFKSHEMITSRSISLAAGFFLVAIFLYFFIVQVLEFARLTQPPQASQPVAIRVPEKFSHKGDASNIFGTYVPINIAPPPATNLPLILVGSFVNAETKKSAAIIQRQGYPAQRIIVGQEIDDGVSLEAVYAARVEIVRNGQRESLSFPNDNMLNLTYEGRTHSK